MGSERGRRPGPSLPRRSAPALRWARRGLVLWLLAAWVPACRRAGSEETLRLAQPADLYSLDPDAAADAQSRSILCNIYEALVEFDRELHVLPALAVSWSAPDDRTWVFELRRGVRFHDGRSFTAADVKFSLERVGGYPPQEPDPVAAISAVEVVDEHHVRLRTLRPDPLLLNRLTQLLVVPGGQTALDSRPIGTGPYRLVRRGPGRLELEAFPDHWRGRPSVGRVSFSAVAEADAARVLRSREVDLYRLLPGSARPLVDSLPGYRAVGRPGLAMTYLWFRCTPAEGRRNPFADPRVRRAVSLALDRAEIVRRLGGHDVQADQLLPKGVFGFMPKWPPPPFSLQRARELLRGAGYGDGFETGLAHAAGDSQRALAGAVREMLAPIGIRVAPEELSWVQILEGRRDQRLGFYALSWTFDDADAWTFLMASLHSRRGPGDLRSTNPGYSNADLDRLIEESSEAPGAEELLRRYQAIVNLAMVELPILPVYSRYDLYAVSERVAFEPRLDGKLVVAEMGLRSR